MVMNTTCTATRTDRGRSAAHGGALLSSGTRITTAMNGTAMNAAPKATFAGVAGVPAYVVDQESHPPRGSSPV